MFDSDTTVGKLSLPAFQRFSSRQKWPHIEKAMIEYSYGCKGQLPREECTLAAELLGDANCGPVVRKNTTWKTIMCFRYQNIYPSTGETHRWKAVNTTGKFSNGFLRSKPAVDANALWSALHSPRFSHSFTRSHSLRTPSRPPPKDIMDSSWMDSILLSDRRI